MYIADVGPQDCHSLFCQAPVNKMSKNIKFPKMLAVDKMTDLSFD